MNRSAADEPVGANAQKIARMLSTPHHERNLLVRFVESAPSAERDAANTAAGAVPKKAYRHVSGLHLVEIPTGNLSDALASYLDNDDVMYAEPDYRIYPSAPDDVYFDQQWGLENYGQDIDEEIGCDTPGGNPVADIEALDAWGFVTDSGTGEWTNDVNFRIAVLDSDVSCYHPDFRLNVNSNISDPAESNIWTNEAELNGNDNEDDDGNGWVDDVHGYNVLDDTGDNVCGHDSHATHVAGTIGAFGDNANGVAGVNWRCKIVTLVIGHASGTISAIIEGMQYVIDNDIKVSNTSWNTDAVDDPQSLKDAIAEAGSQVGHIFVNSAGNQAHDIDDSSGDNTSFPAEFTLRNIIAVAATNNEDEIWYSNPTKGSNWGEFSVDLGAPGVEIYSTNVCRPYCPTTNTYECMSGTSMAAPHVAGVVGMLMAKYPTLKWDKVKQRILDSVRPVNSLGPKRCDGGINEDEVCLDDGDCPGASCVGTPTVTGGVLNAAAAMDPGNQDCNENGDDDLLEDIANETSSDCNDNGIPDECEYPTRIYVDESATGTGDGLTWANAYTSLQDAIDHSCDGVSRDGLEILVIEGDYDPITLRNNVAIYGGFDENETDLDVPLSESDPTANVTNLVDNDTYHVVTSDDNDATAVLCGFHITEGNANGSGNANKVGGGLYLKGSHALIVDCVFFDNDATLNGGAVANMKNGIFRGHPTFVNCIFHNNRDVDQSGAIEKGGAVYSEHGNPEFHNCLFYENEADNGAGIYVKAGGPDFINCTVADNDADTHGGGIYEEAGSASATNCIFWGNTSSAVQPRQQQIYPAKSVTATYSCIRDGTIDTNHYPGEGNIDDDPDFVDTSGDDYTLCSLGDPCFPPASPCVNAGANAGLPADTADLDWDGNLDEEEAISKDLTGDNNRIRSGFVVDMGAYEGLTYPQ